MIWQFLLFLAVGLVFLGGASGIAISNIVAISEKRRLKKSVLSFLLVAMSTSLPELFVAINAIILGEMSVSLGDILGSNITNISLIIGVSLLVASLNHSEHTRMVLSGEERRELITGLMLLSITLLTLLYLQYVGRVIGILLLGIFFVYSYILVQKRKEDGDDNPNETTDRRIGKEIALTIVGIVGVLMGARLTVKSAIEIANFFGVPGSIIGATLVALGTSLPELAVDVRAAYRGYFEIALGDIVGSCFLNSTLILGLLLTFTPFKANLLVLSDLILFGVISNLLLWYFLGLGKIMGRREAVIFLSVYVVYLLGLFEILILRVA